MKLACNISWTSCFCFFPAPALTLGLSLSAPSGTLQQAFSEMRQARVEKCNTIDLPAAEQESSSVPSTEAGIGSNSNNILAPSEAVASVSSATFPAVSLSSTETASPPSSTGKISPPPITTQTQTPSPPASSSHESAPSQHPSPAAVPPSSSTISPPSVQTSVPAVPGSQLSSSSVSSVAIAVPSSAGTVPASEQQPFNSAVASSQPMSSSIHAPQHTNSQCQPVPISAQPPPPTSLPSQSQVQPQPVESEGAELQTKTAGRDDIQALDKKLRSLFKDQSSASSCTSVDPSQNTGTASPPTGTSSPPPGTVLVPPSNLPLTSGQGINPAGRAQTPPTKPRAHVSETPQHSRINPKWWLSQQKTFWLDSSLLLFIFCRLYLPALIQLLRLPLTLCPHFLDQIRWDHYAPVKPPALLLFKVPEKLSRCSYALFLLVLVFCLCDSTVSTTPG